MGTLGPTGCCEEGQDCKEVIPVAINKLVTKTIGLPGLGSVTGSSLAIVNGNVHVESPSGVQVGSEGLSNNSRPRRSRCAFLE